MEPLGTSFRSVVETQVMGANIVVIGCGPIGLFTIASAITLGAAKVISTDVSHARLEIAAEVGADVTLNPNKDNVVKTVLELTGQVWHRYYY